MPFTFAHPAIVFPFAKNKKLPLNALIIGSMVPDFEFYLQLREVEHYGHHTWGFFLIDLPLGLLMLFLYNNYVRTFLRTISPSFILLKCNTLAYNYRSYKKNTISINNVFALTVGILSHLILDQFTHHYSFLMEYLPILKETVTFFDSLYPLYGVNQVFLSILGLVIITIAFIRIKVTDSATKELNFNNLLSFIFLALSILLARLCIFNEYNSFWSIVVAIIGSFFYSLIINSILYHYSKKALNLKKQKILL